jgi:hypothetical protein
MPLLPRGSRKPSASSSACCRSDTATAPTVSPGAAMARHSAAASASAAARSARGSRSATHPSHHVVRTCGATRNSPRRSSGVRSARFRSHCRTASDSW